MLKTPAFLLKLRVLNRPGRIVAGLGVCAVGLFLCGILARVLSVFFLLGYNLF
jgi:hypothetical protein